MLPACFQSKSLPPGLRRRALDHLQLKTTGPRSRIAPTHGPKCTRKLVSASTSGYPNKGCKIAWPSSGRDAWDARWDAGYANWAGKSAPLLLAARPARGKPFVLSEQGRPARE